MECVDLENEWVLWYHSINEHKWDKSSYKQLLNLKDLYDIHLILSIFKQNHYQNGMFFVMKKGVFPNWEDPNNRLGGCLSFKITSTDVLSEWNELLLKCITNHLLLEKNEEINGISISPKKEFNIIKIWLRNDSFDYKNNLIEYGTNILLKNSLYKKHSF